MEEFLNDYCLHLSREEGTAANGQAPLCVTRPQPEEAERAVQPDKCKGEERPFLLVPASLWNFKPQTSPRDMKSSKNHLRSRWSMWKIKPVFHNEVPLKNRPWGTGSGNQAPWHGNKACDWLLVTAALGRRALM